MWSSPFPHPLPRKKGSSTDLLRKRGNLLTGEGEQVGEETNHTTARNPGPLWIIRYSLEKSMQSVKELYRTGRFFYFSGRVCLYLCLFIFISLIFSRYILSASISLSIFVCLPVLSALYSACAAHAIFCCKVNRSLFGRCCIRRLGTCSWDNNTRECTECTLSTGCLWTQRK